MSAMPRVGIPIQINIDFGFARSWDIMTQLRD